ncbi:MAG: ankyrin repeat domain-containing protein [Desulfatibacillum sp.]|nr:ankyrin repeat domain-containing protein [Desulfatibacillum sp.]
MPAYATAGNMETAIQNGDVKTINSLLDNGYAIDAGDESGNTPLLLACFAGQEEAAQLLIERGASVNIQPQSHGLSPLLVASAGGLQNTVNLLIVRGAQIQARGKRGQTALYLAVFSKNFQIIEKLLDAGADPNLKDDLNQAPLYFAAHQGQVDMVKMLLEHGADVHNRGGELEHDALMAASIQGHYEIAKMLMEKDAKFHIPDKQGMTALMFASQLGHMDIVNLMLGRYAHPMLSPFVESMEEKRAPVQKTQPVE